jgi:hypothetical protein
MAVLRWKLVDPYLTDPGDKTYVFPRNPKEMTSPYYERAITGTTTIFNKRLVYEGASPPKAWTFSGPILEKSHFDALREWTYSHKRRFYLYDHFGRRITTVFSSVDMTPVRRVNYYYSHDYTVSALTLDITEPTVPNVGYIP